MIELYDFDFLVAMDVAKERLAMRNSRFLNSFRVFSFTARPRLPRMQNILKSQF